MKKLLLFLVGFYALFSALPANAFTVYLQNDMVWPDPHLYAWNINNNQITAGYTRENLGNGIYKFTLDETPSGFLFRNTEYWNNGQSENATTITDGSLYKVSSEKGVPTICDWYLVGNTPLAWNASESNAIKFEISSNGTFIIKDFTLFNGLTQDGKNNTGFKLYNTDGTWLGDASYQFSPTSKTHNIVNNGDNNCGYNFSNSTDTWTITFNPFDNNQLKFSSSNEDDDDTFVPTLSDWYIVGGVNDWSTNDTYRFTKVSENTYVITGFTALNGKSGSVDSDYGLKIKDNASNTWYGVNTTFSPSNTSSTLSTSGVNAGYNFSSSTNSWTIIWNANAYSLTFIDESAINMPLKPADFANGKAHYFIVGTRMADWRLQPEWELTVSEDGTTATIDDRLFYAGRMAIAKVTNYYDYITHRYTLYSNPGYYVKTSYHSDIALSDKGTKSCIRYSNSNSDQAVPADGLWFTYENNNGKPEESTILTSHPTYVKQVVVTLSNGVPSKLSFNEPTCNQADLNLTKEYTFSLVGSNIGYDGYTDQDAFKTPLDAHSEFNVKNWQESWIQYDPETGEPYIDGNGDAIYQTCFQKSWLVNHPTKFLDASGEKPFEYSSRSITFTNVNSYTDAELNADPYRDLYARYAVLYDDNGNKIANTGSDNSIGNDTDEYLYRPNADDNMSDKNADARTANWQCFVVKDMWMSQQFKVWTGWGGANKSNDETTQENVNKKLARWYYENGGHDIENRKYPVKASSKNDRFYATWRDKNGADFQIGNGTDRVYFKRVIVWYNPSDYFDNSVIQLITELGGPNIYIGREDKNHLHYTYSIPEENDELANVKVKEYYIYRFMVDEAGNEIEGTRILVKSETGLTVDPEYVAGNAVIDANEVSAGTYKYEIAVVYHGNDAAAIEDGTTRIAYSNEISIYEASVPVTATAIQQRDSEGRYSFNIELNANIKSSALDKTTTNGNAVKDLAKYYTVVVTDETLALLNAGTSIEADGAAKSFAKGDVKVADAGEVKTLSNVNYMQFNVPTGDAKDMPTVVFHNIDPSETYPFDVYLTSEDGDIEEFAQLNFDVAKTTATLVIPAPAIAFEDVTLKVHGTDLDGETDPSLMPLGSHRYLGTWQNPEIGLTDPIHYRGVNYATTTGAIGALNVTDEVVNNWTINYDININDTYTYSNEVNSLKDANNHINNTVATLEYFPIDFATEAVAAENAKDGRAYTTYNNAKEDYLASITANYSRSNISTSSNGNGSAFSYTPAFEGMVIDNGATQNTARLYDAGSHYHSTSNNVDIYHDHSYDAIMQVSWALDNDLHKYIGVYAAAQGMNCAGHYITPNDGYWHMHIPSTVLSDAYVTEYSKNVEVLAKIGYNSYSAQYDEANNWALLAAENDNMPIKVHNVWSGNTTINSNAKIDITTTTNYPVLVMNQPSMTIGNAQIASNETPSLKVVAIPTTTTVTLTSDNVFTLTGVEDIMIDTDSDARYYNLQGVEVEKPSNGVYIMVKGQKATKVFIK